MWALLPQKLRLTLVVAAGVAVAWSIDALWSLVSGDSPGALKTIMLSVGVLSAAGVIVLDHTWRRVWSAHPAIGLRTFPDLNGVWRGELQSTWINPDTGTTAPAIPVEFKIRQTLFATHVAMTTGESTSHSTRTFLEPFYETRRFRLWYSYANEPQAKFRHRSAPHEGVAFLELDYDGDPDKLTGQYYTARKTTGDISVERQ